MSEGARLPLGWAVAAASWLFQQWDMSPQTCFICGSVRRRVPEVGDLDIIAPLPEMRQPDLLYSSIDRTVIKPAEKIGLFEAATTEQTARFVEVTSGHKPYFKSLCVVANIEAEGRIHSIPVQVNRYTAQNRGWMELCKTGPKEFGEWFLVKWKEANGIPVGTGQKACHENHLRDFNGNIVPVPCEVDCFRLAGLAHFPPQDRAEIARQAMAGWSQEQRERLA
jgi:hypothetical protein